MFVTTLKVLPPLVPQLPDVEVAPTGAIAEGVVEDGVATASVGMTTTWEGSLMSVVAWD
jgi:hypothetical protein